MRKSIAILRSALFLLVFGIITVAWLPFCLLVMPLGKRVFIPIAIAWSSFHRICARWIVGQRVVVQGTFPKEPAFYVFKHESMFETLDLPHLLRGPVIAAKQELLELPVWGRLARSYGLLAVDRTAGASALRRLRAEAREAIAAGRALCLFPEGTRVPHGEAPALKSGFAGLYSLLKIPVVPVAVLSGELNPKGFLRYSGDIIYRVGEAIPPGLDRVVAEERVHAAINALNSAP